MSDPYRSMASAVLSRLEADSVLATASFDGAVSGSPQGYAVFYLQRLFEYRPNSADPVAVDWTLTVHSVGVTALQARAFGERVMAQLASWRPVFDGWRSSPLRHTLSQPADMDTTVQPAVVFCVDQFSWRSDRA